MGQLESSGKSESQSSLEPLIVRVTQGNIESDFGLSEANKQRIKQQFYLVLKYLCL